MSGGPSNTTTTTTNRLPSWAIPYAKSLLGAGAGQFLPNGQPAQMPSNLNQQVADLTPDQLAALGIVRDTTSSATDLAKLGMGSLEDTLSGKYLDPATDPYLRATFDEAARGVTDQYRLATAPSLQSQALQAGGGGPGAAQGSAFQEAQWANQYGLGQNIQNLATNIYGQNYQDERARMMQAQGLLPATENALYTPANQLLAAGTVEQQQKQTEFDTTFQNALRSANWPMEMLAKFGSILGMATGGAGSQVSISPNTQATK